MRDYRNAKIGDNVTWESYGQTKTGLVYDATPRVIFVKYYFGGRECRRWLIRNPGAAMIYMTAKES